MQSWADLRIWEQWNLSSSLNEHPRLSQCVKPMGIAFTHCWNYKTTVNVSHLDRHPLPRVRDMFAALEGGTVFSKLDMSQSYAQVELDEDSRKHTTINTYRGLFQYRHIPYGIKSASSIFQRSIESVLVGVGVPRRTVVSD